MARATGLKRLKRSLNRAEVCLSGICKTNTHTSTTKAFGRRASCDDIFLRIHEKEQKEKIRSNEQKLLRSDSDLSLQFRNQAPIDYQRPLLSSWVINPFSIKKLCECIALCERRYEKLPDCDELCVFCFEP